MLLNKIKFYAMRAVSNKKLRDPLVNYMANRIGNKIEFSGDSEFISNNNESSHLI